MTTVPAATEQRQSPTDHRDWRELHQLVARFDDGSVLAVLMGLHPGPGVASFRCALVPVAADPAQSGAVVIAESEIEPPAALWEFRASGLWVEQVCEEPLVHWSYGLEAFALAIDQPDELVGRGYGDRVPLGWELDFVGDPENVVADGDDRSGHRLVTQVGRLDGLLLTADGEHPVSGSAVRHHWWGVTDPPGLGAGTGPASAADSAAAGPIALPGPEGIWWFRQ